MPINIKPRRGFSFIYGDPEYEILKRRFNTAWNVAKHNDGGSLNHIHFYLEGTPEEGIVIIEDPKLTASEINTTNRNTAKGLFKGITSGTILPTVSNIGKMAYSAYKGWIDPETGLNTGVAPLPGFTKLGTPVKIVNGVKYYKDTAGNLKTALQILKAKGLKTVVKAPKPSWISPKNHAADYVPKNATGIYNELEKEALRGIELMKDPFFDWRDIDYMNKDLYYKKGGKI